jgi:hypothetical protein
MCRSRSRSAAIVIGLFLLVNVVYIVVLPFDAIQHASADRVATAALETIFPPSRINAHGRGNHHLYLRMHEWLDLDRRVRVFCHRPGWALLPRSRDSQPGACARLAVVAQGIWAAFWCCRGPMAARRAVTNLYNNLLNYIFRRP